LIGHPNAGIAHGCRAERRDTEEQVCAKDHQQSALRRRRIQDVAILSFGNAAVKELKIVGVPLPDRPDALELFCTCSAGLRSNG